MSKRAWVVITLTLLLFFGGVVAFFVALFSLASQDQIARSDAQIAVIEIEGPIFESKATIDDLKKARKNDHIKAVVLRIDSPGGAVAPSEEIYRAVLKLKEKKKVVVSMGTVAASGGYYIAAAADKIVANRGTITGSIGVIMQHMNVQDTLALVKLRMQALTAGKLKDVGSSIRDMTDEDRAFLQSLLDNMHGQFKNAVKTGRGFSDEEINRIADGRVFTGEQALKEKLVDKIGGLEEAIDLAKDLAGIQGEPKVSYPKKKRDTILQLLMDEEASTVIQRLFFDLSTSKAMYLMKG